MANSNQNQLIARARAANRTFIDQNLLSQEVKCPTKELIQATKREELRVPVTIPGKDLNKPRAKMVVVEIQAPKTSVETPVPRPLEPEPQWIPSQELLDELSLKVTSAIEKLDLTSAKMTEVTKIFYEVKSEIQKPAPDWDKVTGLLKKCLDYSLQISADIIKLAAIYYQAKAPVKPPKKKPKVVEVVVRSENPQAENNNLSK